jgi:hypothetical protein
MSGNEGLFASEVFLYTTYPEKSGFVYASNKDVVLVFKKTPESKITYPTKVKNTKEAYKIITNLICVDIFAKTRHTSNYTSFAGISVSNTNRYTYNNCFNRIEQVMRQFYVVAHNTTDKLNLYSVCSNIVEYTGAMTMYCRETGLLLYTGQMLDGKLNGVFIRHDYDSDHNHRSVLYQLYNNGILDNQKLIGDDQDQYYIFSYVHNAVHYATMNDHEHTYCKPKRNIEAK